MTGHLLYTEEDVELLTEAIFEANAVPWPNPQTIPAERYARAVLFVLQRANRLVPPGSEVRERLAATAETLHVVAGWGDVDADELHRVAEEVAAGDVADWWACPVCEETDCDDGCPLAPVRSPSVPDTEEGS